MPEGVGAAVVDASTFADYFLLYPGERERHERARAVIDRLSALGVTLCEPSLFEAELRSVPWRRLGPATAIQWKRLIYREGRTHVGGRRT